MIALHLEGRIIAADEWIKAAGFYPDYVTRLYDKSRVNYDSRADHAAVVSKNTTKN